MGAGLKNTYISSTQQILSSIITTISGAMTLLGTATGTNVADLTVTPTTAGYVYFIVARIKRVDNPSFIKLRINGASDGAYDFGREAQGGAAAGTANADGWTVGDSLATTVPDIIQGWLVAGDANAPELAMFMNSQEGNPHTQTQRITGSYDGATAHTTITSVTLLANAGNITGTLYVYGVAIV